MNRNWVRCITAIMWTVWLANAGAQEGQFSPGAEPGQAATAGASTLSTAAGEVVTLAEAGTSEEVILAYIQNSTAAFGLSADQVLYLRDIGVSSAAISAMLSRDNALRGQGYGPGGPLVSPAPEPAPQSAPADAPPPAYVGNPPPEVGYFYGDLAPYGAWVQLEGVGWCWQPRVVRVSHGWRPYCDSGHWVWSDAGWYWQSDYSWGWAPFHYGRWQLHERCGWVWLPDRVWGPAWVTWRSVGEQCGWAPLPPHAEFDARLGWRFNGVSVGVNFDFGLRPEHFAFVALKDFNERDLGHRRLPAAEVTRVYHQTTIINNYVVNHNTVVNQGIKVERVAAATHTQIRQATIRDVPAGGARGVAAAGADRNGLVVYRPQLKAPTTPVHNMVAQQIDERHPVVQHPAIVTARPDSRPAPAGNPAARPGVPRRPQTEMPGTAARPMPQQTPTYTRPYAPVKPTAPAQNTPSVPTARLDAPKHVLAPATTYAAQPNGRPASQVSVAPPAGAPVPAHIAEQPKATANPVGSRQAEKPSHLTPGTTPASAGVVNGQAARPGTSFRPDTSEGPAPGNTSARAALPQSSRAPNPAQNQNPHVYFPKSAHQAAEAHSLPPLNPRATPAPAAPTVQPAGGGKKGDS